MKQGLLTAHSAWLKCAFLNHYLGYVITFIALMADFVMEIIFALEMGGFESIKENNCGKQIIKENTWMGKQSILCLMQWSTLCPQYTVKDTMICIPAFAKAKPLLFVVFLQRSFKMHNSKNKGQVLQDQFCSKTSANTNVHSEVLTFFNLILHVLLNIKHVKPSFTIKAMLMQVCGTVGEIHLGKHSCGGCH